MAQMQVMTHSWQSCHLIYREFGSTALIGIVTVLGKKWGFARNMLDGRSGRFFIVVWMVTLRNGRNRTWQLIQGPPGYSWKSLNSCNVPAFKMEFITSCASLSLGRPFVFQSHSLWLKNQQLLALIRHLFMTLKMPRSASDSASLLLQFGHLGPLVEADGSQGIQDSCRICRAPSFESSRGELILPP